MERRKDSLVSWRGRDEYDRFAEALGSTLPRITDGFPEENTTTNSEGDTEFLETPEAAVQFEKGEEKDPPASTPLTETTKLTRLEMAGVMRISPFVGKGDGKENPIDFIADVEMAARSWDVIYGADVNNPEASKIALFRQNLDRNGDAWHWWSCVLEDELKGTFGAIKGTFLARYSVAKNKTVSRFNVQNELMLLQQRQGQAIAEYVFEAERLSERVPKDMDSMLAMVFIRGLADQECRRRISYDLRDTPEFTFTKALHMVKSWHQEIGIPDPFNPHSVGFSSYNQALVTPLYAPPSKNVAVAAKEQTAKDMAMAKEGQSASSMQEAFNQMMINFMGTMKSDFQQSPHRTPSVTNTASRVAQMGMMGAKRESGGSSGVNNIVCFNCGGGGHISTACKNAPLPYAEQKRVRVESRAERDAIYATATPVIDRPATGRNTR